MRIESLLDRRSDLSTFIVHLTRRTEDGSSPGKNLRSILKGRKIEARTAFGPAAKRLQQKGGKDYESQKCVSFSETPLEHLYCLAQEIPQRKFRLSPYGLVFTKMTARKRGLNPIWYVDITPGHDWLMGPINVLIDRDVSRLKRFRKSHFAQISPFIEQMGSGPGKSGIGYRKEFWWEREWRYRGDFSFLLSDVVMGVAPGRGVGEFEKLTKKLGGQIPFVDPKWSLEKMIAHLAGYQGVLSPFDE